MQYCEANFDGLVGPTHNYAGLSFGNVASFSNANAISNPKEAAKQGLQKMKALADMGMVQGVLAPQERPDLATLRRLGFAGSATRSHLLPRHFWRVAQRPVCGQPTPPPYRPVPTRLMVACTLLRLT